MEKEITEFEFAKPIEGFCKSPVLLGRIEGVGLVPLFYLRKPRWMTSEDFEKLISSTTIKVPRPFSVEVSDND